MSFSCTMLVSNDCAASVSRYSRCGELLGQRLRPDFAGTQWCLSQPPQSRRARETLKVIRGTLKWLCEGDARERVCMTRKTPLLSYRSCFGAANTVLRKWIASVDIAIWLILELKSSHIISWCSLLATRCVLLGLLVIYDVSYCTLVVIR